MAKILFEYACPRCPGDGVVRPKRPGIDWLEPCTCESRKTFSQYQLGRILDERPETIVRLHEMRTGYHVAVRVLHKLDDLVRFGTMSRFGKMWREAQARRELVSDTSGGAPKETNG